MKRAAHILFDAFAEWLAEKLRKPRLPPAEPTPDTVMERLQDYVKLTHKLFEGNHTISYCVHPDGEFTVIVPCRKCNKKNRLALNKSIYTAICGSCHAKIVKSTLN